MLFRSGGISNLYSYKLNGDRSNVYAYRTLALESGQYNIAFDWKLLGRNSEDLLCAFLVPATAEMMVAGNGDLTTHYPYTSSYFNTTSMKPGWNLLGGNALLMQTSWQSFSQVVTITEPGNYRLVFYWANKSNPWGSDANPPAAVDNVSVTEILCASPGAIDAVLTDTSANLTWVSFNGANRWEVKVSTSTMTQTALNNNQANVFNGYTTQESLMVNGLQGNTTYYCYLRSFCTAADTSLWAMYEFKTPCGTLNDFPISFNFDGLIHNSVPACWTVVTAYNGLPSIYN